MTQGLKVRALEDLYYDAVYGPGKTAKVGGKMVDLSEFFLKRREDFNPNLMEAIGWTPDKFDVEDLRVKEDGTLRTSVEVANIKSDKLDDSLRAARSAKAQEEQAGFEKKIELKPELPRL